MTATIDATGLDRRVLDPAIEADVEKFERLLAQYEAGELEEDRWRVFRLANGIYGQRQGGTNQMVRVKIPYGSLRPEQLEMLGHIAREYSRGWGHITTRQNVQFHYVDLHRIPAVMRELGWVGRTPREACGDTVRNVAGCHLAGACPFEVLDISPWAEATYRHFLRHPYAQRLPRKFKINFSGCATDCGQAMFNDVGVVAVTRARADGSTEAGFRVFVAGGLGATPHPALALEEFTPREELLATIEAVLRVFDPAANRQNVVFRGLDEGQLPDLYAGLDALGLARPGAELARDVVSCPGADTCNLAVTQSRGLASAIDSALDEAGLAEVGGVRVNISGCSNSCGQHHTADIGFFGVERRAHGRSAPGYQLLLGGHLGDASVEFGRKALRLPAKACAEATVRLVGRFAAEREAAETFTGWLARV